MTPLQEYYLLNLEKPRRPVEKGTRDKAATSTGAQQPCFAIFLTPEL
jgi:hypothetical protein